jgi:asparagine synthetase B (glutamine-hydrolysing)
VSDATLFRGVSRVPSASIWRFGSDGVAESRYWTPRFGICPGQPVDAALDAFRSAVSRATAGPRTAIALSGGLDTRAILASTISLGRPVDGFTAGQPDSADVRVARRLARHLKGEWHNVVIDDDFLDRFDRWAEAAVKLSDGTLGVENAHLAYLNTRLPGLADTLVDGGGAEASKRGLLHSAAVRARDSGELADVVMRLFSRPDAALALLGPGGIGRAAERLRELLRQRLTALAHDSVGDTLDAFFIRHMWTGYHGAGVAMQNEHIGCQLPFLDNQFLDALMQVPLNVRGRSALNFFVVKRCAPELERYPRVWMDVEIPWSNSRLLSLIPPIAVRVVHRLLNRPAFPIARWMGRDLREQARAAAESFARRGVMCCDSLKAALARGDAPLTGTTGRAARMAWRFDIWHREFLDARARGRHPPPTTG